MSFMNTRSTNFLLSLFFVVLMNLQGNINLFWWKKLDKKCYYISKAFFLFPSSCNLRFITFLLDSKHLLNFFCFPVEEKKAGEIHVSQFINWLIKWDFYHMEYYYQFLSLKSKLFTSLARWKYILGRRRNVYYKFKFVTIYMPPFLCFIFFI